MQNSREELLVERSGDEFVRRERKQIKETKEKQSRVKEKGERLCN